MNIVRYGVEPEDRFIYRFNSDVSRKRWRTKASALLNTEGATLGKSTTS
jgi:hypothetical protein